MILIAEHLGSEVTNLGSQEYKFNEGDRGEVNLFMTEPISSEMLIQLEDYIIGQGVTLTAPIAQDAGMISIQFEKRLAPLAIIALGILAVGVVGAGILGWQILKAVSEIPTFVWAIGGMLLVYWMFFKPHPRIKGAAKATGRGAVKVAPAAVTMLYPQSRAAALVRETRR